MHVQLEVPGNAGREFKKKWGLADGGWCKVSGRSGHVASVGGLKMEGSESGSWVAYGEEGMGPTVRKC